MTSHEFKIICSSICNVNLDIPISALLFCNFYGNNNFPLCSSYFTLQQFSNINPFYNQNIVDSEGDKKTITRHTIKTFCFETHIVNSVHFNIQVLSKLLLCNIYIFPFIILFRNLYYMKNILYNMGNLKRERKSSSICLQLNFVMGCELRVS